MTDHDDDSTGAPPDIGEEVWQRLEELILGPGHLTRVDLSERTGIGADEARELWKALGFAPVPDDVAMFTETDLEALARVQAFRTLGVAAPDTTIQLARVLGQAAARVAEAQVHAVDNPIRGLFATAGEEDTEDMVAWVAEYVVPGFVEFVTYAWKRHLVAAVGRRAMAEGGADTVVGFADLVGFTALSLELEDDALARTIDRFETLAYDRITTNGGRPVKIIGDEIMFVADEITTGAETALDLVEAFARDPELPNLRTGLAAGPAVQIEGDLYGPIVNLASRLAVVARPGTVIVSDVVAGAVGPGQGFAVRPIRPRHLKGIGDVRLWVLRRRAGKEPG